MMKRLFILLFILCSLQAFSQPVTGSFGASGTTTLFKGSAKVSEFFFLPGIVSDTPSWAGAARYNPTDSSMYLWTGYNWVKSGGGSTPTYDTYNTSDTLTASRTVTLGSYQVRFYKDPTSYVIINPAYLSAIYKSASDANQTSTFQAAPYYSFLKNSYVMGGTTANASISTEANPDARRVLLEYNRGAPIVNQVYVDEDGLHVQNKDSVGFAVDADGLISIDTLPAGSGVAVLWDSTTKKLSYGSGGGGASTTSDLTDVSDAAPANNTVLTYNQDSGKYVPTAVVAYNFTNLRDGQYLSYDSVNNQWVNVDAPTGGSTGTADTAYSIPYRLTPPATGNVYFNASTHKLGILNDEGTYWLYFTPTDSVVVGGAPSDDLTFAANSSGLVNTSQVFTPNAANANFEHKGLDAKYLAANEAGRLYFKYEAADGGGGIIGFTPYNALGIYTNMYAGVYITTGGDITAIDNGTPEGTGLTATVGKYYAIYRTAGGVYTLQESSDGVSWTNIYTSIAYTDTAINYVIMCIYGDAAAHMYYPKGDGLTN